MTELEKRIWTESIGRVLKENTPWDSKNQSERYHVVADTVKMPPKVVLARAINIIEKEHPDTIIKKIGGGIPTNRFIEELGFKITEDLIYNITDFNKFRSHIEKRIHNRKLFQDFINFGFSVLTDLAIEVYKVRTAIESKGILSIIVGMRAVYSYEEEEGTAIIGLLVSKSFKNENQDKLDFISAYDFKGEPSQQLVKVRVNDWSEMSQALLDEFKAQFELQYDQIKNSKLTQWNVEANTTNNALKYVFFKNENIDYFLTHKMDGNNPNLIELLRKRFKRIWRCADSYKWEILKQHDLLTFDWLDNDVDYSSINIKESGSGKRAIEPWVNQMKKGDLVFVMGKNQFNGIAIVESEYAYRANVIDLGSNGVKPSVKVKYISKLDKPINHSLKTHNNPTTFAKLDAYRFSLEKTIAMLKIKEKKTYNALVQLVSNISNMEDYKKIQKVGVEKKNLNTILYGPPGTGKTYQTISNALEIVDQDYFLEYENNRAALLEKFNELTISNWSDTKGQIAFCTFHQSFTYEDFVEGIKPKVIDDKDIIYEVQKGVFKSLCDRARTATNDSSDFDSTINSLQNDILEEGPVTLATNRGNKFDVNYTGQTTFRIKPHESTAENPQYPASIENIRALYEGAPLTDLYNPSYVKGILEYLYKRYDLPKYQEVKNNDKPYVIIIDEINRGNVASIFGELITLIEPNKRSGAIEELSVILPYSKKEFTVPNNVHIIGTMNTADRSVEALDTALRRRFSFKEIMPDYSVIEKELGAANYWNNSSVSEILKKINKRITHLIDRDHQIGHSYFLKLKEVPATEFSATMAAIFSENIIPLLQEYFFNDFSKIGMVIGEGFLNNIEWGANDFAKFDEGNSEDYEDNLFEIIDPKSMKIDQFEEAIKSLLN